MEEKEIISAGKMLAKKKKKKSAPVRTEFTLPDPRCEHCHYWQSLSSHGNFRKACHFALHNGKLREKISKTECGSFLDESNAPKYKPDFDCVPMIQWGCGGLNIYRKTQ